MIIESVIIVSFLSFQELPICLKKYFVSKNKPKKIFNQLIDQHDRIDNILVRKDDSDPSISPRAPELIRRDGQQTPQDLPLTAYARHRPE